MPSNVNAKSVTRNVGWSVLSKTGTFGLKFVTVPILARQALPQTVAQTIVTLLATKFQQPVCGHTRVQRRNIVKSSTKGDIR